MHLEELGVSIELSAGIQMVWIALDEPRFGWGAAHCGMLSLEQTP
jgi:hypothetical protein